MGKRNRNKKTNKSENAPVISDERFSTLHSDPRFQRPSINKNKVKVDTRFKAIFDNEMEFSTDAKVDKYGRKTKRDVKKELSKFYQMEEEEEEEKVPKEGSEQDSEEESVEDKMDEEARKKLIFARSRGEVLIDSESESEAGESTEEEYDELEEVEEDEDEVPRGDETRRFACMNMDWDHIKSKDLFKVFTSFKPESGIIKSVAIYPSEFGKQRIEHESLYGPPKEIFEPEEKKEYSDSEEDSEEENGLELEDEGTEFHQENLRKYQLERLKYYYAVVECDSINTAKKIYDACDGDEYESTANFFDLRFIPDDMEFEDEPRDKAIEDDITYKSNNFVTKALTNSKVSLTWDQDDPERVQLLQKAFTEAEVDDMNFDAFLASDGSDSETEVNSLRQKYRDLIKSGNNEEEEDVSDDNDMQITFTPGLDENKDDSENEDESELENQSEGEGVAPVQETSVEKYLRKERERLAKKKAVRMEKIKEKQELNPPKTKAELKEEEKRKKAELELVMMDQENEHQHFDLKQVIKAEKNASRKGKKKNKVDTELIQDEFQIDTKDSRFDAIHQSHHFAIDPTHPQFKSTKAMKQILNERQRRSNDKIEEVEIQKEEPKQDKEGGKAINLLINAVKRKAEAFKNKGKRTK